MSAHGRWRVATVTALVLLAAAAVAASSKTVVKGLGSADVRWNKVGFREELMEQLSPGLTWRLGKGGATRLEIQKMALVGYGAMLLPGEVALNLRFWGHGKWELVAFELTSDGEDWKWSEEKEEFGVIPAEVTEESDPKLATKKLELELRATAKGKRTPPLRAPKTGDEALLAEVTSNDDDVDYSPAARKEWEAVPELELHMRFGPHHGLVRFEPVKLAEVKGEVENRDDEGEPTGKKRKVRILYGMHGAVTARTEWMEEHGGELTFAVWDVGAPEEGLPVALVLTGTDTPALWPVTRDGAEPLEPIMGRREPTAKTPKTLEVELADGILTVHVAKFDYVFRL